ncbi:hypothetical protein J6S37_02080 [Candidatus Saccharibacteria bacterium]|nr:hypothetical protein [Candidatus Saccharibacteria bacterium]
MKKRGPRKFKIKTWQLIVVLIPLLFLDATFLRFDHIKMTKLRDDVIAADAAENDEEIQRTLEELKKFVFSNIVINIEDNNGRQEIKFGTGLFYLEHQYIRAANAALQEAEKNFSDNNPNGNVYAMASSVCQPLAIQNGWTWNDANFINCMMSEINKYPAADELQDKIIASLPSTELYRKEYSSPLWAPTLTGFMLLITLIIIVVIFIRCIIWIILRLSLLFV